MRISDWSSDVCSSDLPRAFHAARETNCCHARNKELAAEAAPTTASTTVPPMTRGPCTARTACYAARDYSRGNPHDAPSAHLPRPAPARRRTCRPHIRPGADPADPRPRHGLDRTRVVTGKKGYDR